MLLKCDFRNYVWNALLTFKILLLLPSASSQAASYDQHWSHTVVLYTTTILNSFVTYIIMVTKSIKTYCLPLIVNLSSFIQIVGSHGKGGEFEEPVDVKFNTAGHMYVVEFGVQVMDKNDVKKGFVNHLVFILLTSMCMCLIIVGSGYIVINIVMSAPLVSF